MKVKEAILLLCVVFAPVVAEAQVPVRDNEKKKQWQSMENGPWDFAPDWSTGTITSCTRVTPARRCTGNGRASSPDSVSASRSPNRTSSVSCPHGSYPRRPSGRSWRELVREADRAVDLVYPAYKDEFNRMQDCITDGLLYCMTKSGGKLKPQVDELGRQNEILCAGIAYIRKTGVGYGLENAKRQQAYEEAKGKMEALVKQTANLCAVAATHY